MTETRCPRDSDWCDGVICRDLGYIDCPNADRRLIVLNNDSVVCGHCYEDSTPLETEIDSDPGLMPMGYVTEGECYWCGYRLPVIDHSDTR